MSVGRCRHCGYSPVGQDAIWCPECAGAYPNMSPTNSCITRLVTILAISFFVVLGLIILVIVIGAIG